MSDQTTLRATFVSESAGYRNTFGWYNSVTGLGGILFASVEAEGSNPTVVGGVSYADFTVNTTDVANIQFFLISNGAVLNKNDSDDLTGPIKVIQLSNGTWAVADVDSDGNVITKNGKPDLLMGAGVNALFTETSKNAGNVDYASSVVGAQQTASTLAGDTADGATGTIAWEDLAAKKKSHGTYAKPGDADYNDAVFQISIVAANNNPPVANADAVTIGEDDAPTTVNVLANDAVPNAGDMLHIIAVDATGSLGTVTIAADGLSVSYVPAAAFQSLGAGQTATETFTYTVVNGSGTTSSATTTVTVLGVNDAALIGMPTVRNVTEDAGVSGAGNLTATGILAISDVDQGQASFQATVGTVAGNLGSLTIASNGAYSYAVANSATQYLGANESRTDIFTVSSLDGTTQQVSFAIHGSQDAPNLLVGPAASGLSDANIDLSIGASLIDATSTLRIVIDGVPSAYTLNHGIPIEEGRWLLSATELPMLTLVPNGGVGASGVFNLHITATSDDGTNQATTSADIAVTVSASATETNGSLIDGYIAGATVFADANSNGILDAGEAHTTTNANGSFTLTNAVGPLVSFGGTDLSTGLQFTGVLRAPEGSTVITPLTTLISALVSSTADDLHPLTVAEAASAVATAFNLDPTINLQTFDPVPGAVSGNDPAATAILSAAIQVQSTVVQVSSVAGAASSAGVFTAIADAITAAQADPVNTPVFDLTSSSTVESVASGAGVSNDALAAVVDVVSAANTSIDSATSVTELAQAGQVAQGAAAQQLANTDFTDPSAVSALQQAFVTDLGTQVAAAVVGDVDGAQLGTLGNDVLVGGNGNDSIDGLDGNDQISGGAGNDFLFGGDARDYLTGGSGSDQLGGGSGFDRAVYSDATGGIAVSLAVGTASGAGVGTDTLASIEGIVGSDFADTFDAAGFLGDSVLPGTPIGFNEFEGRGGDDIIVSNVNSQGAQLTRVSYVSATAAVTVDISAGTADGDASVGHDTFVGSGIIGAWGSAFNDTLMGSNNGFGTAEVFAGFAGNDTINGRGGFDRADYNNDPAVAAGINVNVAAGIVTGDASIGTDTLLSVEAVRGTNFADTYDATGFSGSSANAGSLGTFNEFTGNGGDDTIIGNGNTRLGFNNATAGITVDLVAGTATGDGSVGNDNFTGVNAVQASMFNDTVRGGATNDTITGLAGDDLIDGRGGFDTASYNNTFFTTGSVTVNLAAGTATGDASIGNDTLRNIEGVQGTNFADTFNAVGYGLAGALNVSSSNGTFNQFEGLAGDDIITGNGNTRLGYFNATAGVTIDMQAGSASGNASVGHDTFIGVNSATGSNFADVYDATGFTGVSAAGSFGTFNGFQGQGGDDIITGNGNTQVQYNNATAGVAVDLATGHVNGDASVGHDTITGGVNSVQGSNFNDTISGGTGNENLSGNVGDDIINGGGGNDFLTGGAGADRFIHAAGGGADFVQDFNRGQGDRIDVIGVTGIYGLADIQSRATQVGANTVIDFGSGDTITLQNITIGSLVASDFVFPNTISGTPAAETLVGTGQADAIFGLAGNDRLQGLAGNDLLDGGLGFDRAIYTETTGGITVNLAAGTASGSGVGADTLIAIEGAVGSDFADTYSAAGFTGSNGIPGSSLGTNEFEGRGGDDTIIGAINALGQTLTRIAYVSATAAVTVDIAAGAADGDASVGHDSISNISTVWGSASNDTLRGSNNAFGTFESYEGRGGDDFIDGRGGYDQATYNNDTTTTSGITVQLAAGTVTGDATVGTDTLRAVEAVRGTHFDDVYDATGFGSVGAVNIGSSGTFNDFGGAGGNDTVIGNGFTRLNYQLAIGAITVDLETSVIGTTTATTVVGTATGAGEGTDSLTGVNAVQGSTFADTLLGSSFGNNFTGLGGDDFIDGRGGFDTAIYNSLTTTTGGVSVNLAAGTATGDPSIGADTLRSIEGVQGTGFADSFVATGYGIAGAFNAGNNGNFNQFEGLGGDDSITGNGNTRLIYTNATAGVSVDLIGGTAAGDASVGTDTFTLVNSVQGSNFADTYVATGFVGFNSFTGLGGDDSITGNGNTQIFFNNATAGVTVDLATGHINGDASVGHDTITGGVNNVQGTNFSDTITGGSGNDFINGNGGNDTINGGGGDDTLIGSGGNDNFVFNANFGTDTVTDFQHGADHLDFSAALFTSQQDVLDHATQSGTSVVVTSNSDTVTLLNTSLANLNASDFLLH